MEFNYFDTMVRAQKGYGRLMEPVCRQWELTRNELDVVLFLANNPEQDRAADIVTGRGMSKSHVSLSVSNLEKRGLLTRREDPADRRTVHLSLTEDAQPVVEAGRAAQQEFFSFIHRGVSQAEVEAMIAFSKKLGENIRQLEEIQIKGSK